MARKLTQALVREEGAAFTQSVYGPLLASNWNDSTFMQSATGRYGFYLHDLLRKKRARKSVFLDIGANIGLYSLLAERNDTISQIYAFEPNPVVYERFVQNIEANGCSRIKPMNIGIADKDGKAMLSYKDHHHGRGNFLDLGDEKIAVQIRDHKVFKEIMDECGHDVDVILKIDVEGFEPVVIREILKCPELIACVSDLHIEISHNWVSDEDVDFIFETVRSWGLKEVFRSGPKHQYDMHFTKA